MATDLLIFNKSGIYCSQADVYIDPWKPVAKALITHGHSDHARRGSQKYICHKNSVPILKYRLGKSISVHGINYGDSLSINGVRFSFHPAGHIIGSAQIRVEYKGEIWVVSGDYKTHEDNITVPFSPVKCHTFITESTFGLPIYQWKPLAETAYDINTWWADNANQKRPTIITAYSLGKAQSLLQNVDASIGPIYCHGAVQNTNDILKEAGLFSVDTLPITDKKEDYTKSLIIAPPAALGSLWAKRFKGAATASASGWMALRGMRRRRSVDRGFVMSDHADWRGLNAAISATGAERVIVTHGYQDIFTRYLNELGYWAQSEKTLYEGELAMAENEEKV